MISVLLTLKADRFTMVNELLITKNPQNKMLQNKIFLLRNIILTTLIFALTACNQKPEKWVVGTSADNPPYEFMQNGEIVGFDIDVINEIAERLNGVVEIRNMEFHGLLAALSTENINMAIAGLSITSEREKQVKFSKPYSKAHIAILTRKEADIDSQEALKGKIIGSQLGTSWTFIAKEIAKQQEADLVNLASNLMLVEELKNKRLDAVILEKSQAIRFSQSNTGLTYLPAEEYHTYFAIAYPKRAPLRSSIDKVIVKLRKEGVIDQLAKKWGVNGSSNLEIIDEKDKCQIKPDSENVKEE